MKFKVGDKVRVRKDLEMDEVYGAQIFVGSMRKYRGKVMEIKEIWVWSAGYILKEAGSTWVFTDEMLEPLEDPQSC